MTLTLSPEEIDRRLPVWCELSELFLDSELEDSDYERIARTIVMAHFSRAEAREILRREVAPVFWINHRTVAGEWQPWPAAQVRDLVTARLKRRPWWNWPGWLRNRVLDRMTASVEQDWARIEPFLA